LKKIAMDSLDLQVLAQARDWFREGHRVWLVTVLETWGSAPRPPGALLCLRGDGLVLGSVSGGCVEDDLIARIRNRPPAWPDRAGPGRENADRNRRVDSAEIVAVKNGVALLQKKPSSALPLRTATATATATANANANATATV